MLPPDSWLEHQATDSLGRTFDWLRLLGRGGFGEVYLARMSSPSGLEQQVAVKLLPAGLAPDSRAVVRLRQEAHVLASLRHPVVLAPHDLAELGGRIALVTEFIEGEDLSACIATDDPAPLPVSTQLEVIEQVASALEVAWKQLRLVHRDVKPQNIRIGRHGNVKLLDFGLASTDLGERATHTSADVLVGTVRYLAPERFDTKRDPTPASDVYSLGCVLFEGVTGGPFVTTASVPTLVQRIAEQEGWDRSVTERVASVADGRLRSLLESLLAHDPSRRPTAEQVRERCERLRAEMPSHVGLARWCRDRVWPDPDTAPPSLFRPHTARASGHPDEARLGAADLSTEEASHVATCVRCRTARRILLEERTGWTGESSGGFLDEPIPAPRRRLRTPVALGVALLLSTGLLALGVTWSHPPPAEQIVGATRPLVPVAPVVEAEATIPIPQTAEPSTETPAASEKLPAPAPIVAPKSRKPPELYPVFVRTRPYGNVRVGDQTWTTEDPEMRLPAGRYLLHLVSYDRRYDADVPFDVAAAQNNTLCWDHEKEGLCSY